MGTADCYDWIAKETIGENNVCRIESCCLLGREALGLTVYMSYRSLPLYQPHQISSQDEIFF
jgi:hypothetical protein